MSNSQGNRREIIRLPEFPRSNTPVPAPKRQRTSHSTSKNIISIPKESRPRVTRPQEAAIEDAVVTSSPTRVIDSSERSSQPKDSPQMTTSWTLPKVTTSTGVDTGAMPTTDLEQAAWNASVMPISTGTDADGMSMAVVSVTGEKSDGPTSTRVGTDERTSSRAIDSDGGATSEKESSSCWLISVEHRWRRTADKSFTYTSRRLL